MFADFRGMKSKPQDRLHGTDAVDISVICGSPARAFHIFLIGIIRFKKAYEIIKARSATGGHIDFGATPYHGVSHAIHAHHAAWHI